MSLKHLRIRSLKDQPSDDILNNPIGPARHIQLPSEAVFSVSVWRSLAIILIVIVVVLVGGLLYIWTKKA